MIQLDAAMAHAAKDGLLRKYKELYKLFGEFKKNRAKLNEFSNYFFAVKNY